MRHAASFALAFTASLAAGALFLACGAGEKEDPPGTRGTGGSGGYDLDQIFGNRDGGFDGSSFVPNDSGVSDAGSDASPTDPDAGKPVTCESCGSAQSATECGAALAACRANPGCKRIYDCIYTFRGCGLTSSDIPCIQGCLDDYCDDARSVELYLAYDQCTYCSDACKDKCSSYCSGFPNSGMIPTRCTHDVADGGTDAEDAGIPDADAVDGSDELDAGEEPDAEPEEAGPGRVCIPGQQIACACVGGGQGAQVCNAEGSGYGPCVCPPRPDAGSGGQGGEGGSGGAGGASGDDDDDDDDDGDDDDDDDDED